VNTERWQPKQVFVYRHPVDMRKQILGLSNIVTEQLERDPGDECLYVFVNKARDKVKLLIWHRNGFWLLYKRLQITHDQLDQLIDGYNLNGMRPHRALTFAHSA